ncbi:MAG: alpha/beta hydrolase [Gammaproteobacteria bacterium]|nr:alpha/beta hydrolase [Gammaproteobacteria bacterium]
MCKKLISLNVPYFPRGTRPLHEMLSYSRFDYMRDFQKPGNAEAIIESDSDHFIKRVFITYAASENYITEDELKVFSNSFKNPGDITPALEYYRNLTLNWKLTENRAYKKIRTPTLMIVGDLDPLLTPDMFLGVEKYVPNVTVKHISCGHWMQQEAPKKTNEYILEFIL